MKVAQQEVDLTSTQIITLDPEKYVAAVFAPFRERLDEAKAGAPAVVPDVTTKEGMLVAIKQRAIFRKIRLEVEEARKLRKAPILEISRKLDGRAKEIAEEISPNEERFDAAIKAEETRKERERAEQEAKELARVTHIQNCIAEIVAKPGTMVGKPSSQIGVALDDMRAHDITQWAQEFLPQAAEAKLKAIEALELMLAGTKAQEDAAKAESERIAREREELARLRAEQEERSRNEQARIAEETRQRAEADAAARAKIEAEERASRERIEAEERAARLSREETDRKAAAEREQERQRQARIQAEAERAWAEKEAAERAKRAAEEAEAARLAAEQAERERVLRAEQERLDAEKRELARQQEELLAIDRLIGVLRDRIKGLKQYAGILKAIDAYLKSKSEKEAA